MRHGLGRAIVSLGAVVVIVLGSVAEARAQNRPQITIEREDGTTADVPLEMGRGYATVPVSVLVDLGWSVVEEGGGFTLGGAGEITVSMRTDSPFFRWDGVVLQLTDAPYRADGVTYVPAQFLTDFLPRRLPGLYEFSGEQARLRAGDVSLLGRDDGIWSAASDAVDGGDETGTATGPYDGVRVVVVDAGHGGFDPGALGVGGVREKTVALGIARHLARILSDEPDLEVHMIRDDDTFVDLWERGQIATELKGERPGAFVSIHANSFPARRDASGFETYFLSDARNEHEARVEAIENAPLSMSPEGVDEDALADLDFILRDLKNYDHAHWSEDLAGLVQAELDDVHPGQNRGVKQGVLAVLTNALMPSVLVEVGYLSNETEGRLLARDDFQEDSAEAIAGALVRFFERYPPGSGAGGSRDDS